VGCRRSTLPTWWQKLRAGGGWLEGAAAQVAAWLAETHGIQRSRKSIYYWLEKFGFRATPPVSLLPESAPAKPAVPTLTSGRVLPGLAARAPGPVQ
jgi:hypothetical protein